MGIARFKNSIQAPVRPSDSLYRGIGLSALLCFLTLGPSSLSFALDTPVAAPTTISREALIKLGKKFAEKIGTKMKETEILLEGNDKLKLAEIQSGNALPENELLIFRGLVGKDKIRLSGEIYGIILNERLMLSLGTFTQATDLALSVSAEKGIAEGWFIREDQTFYLDANKGEITIMNETGNVNADDLYIEGEDLFVSSTLIEKWFGLEINIDLSGLSLQILSTQPLPIEDKKSRGKRPLYSATNRDAKLPLKEEPYKFISAKPYLDVALNSSLQRANASSDIEKKADWSVIGSGDLAGFSSQTFISGSLVDSQGSNDTIRNLRQTFSREDAEGNLLGPLKAKQVTFGDINPVSMPLIGGGQQGQGIRISNKLSTGSTTLGVIDVDGNAQPGWDVELYRNDSLIGLQRVEDDGRYLFDSVFLFAGNNALKLVFYGPQGEVREETREIFSGLDTQDAWGGTWDVSATRQNTATYSANPSETPIDGDPQFSAKYERSFGVLGTGRFGLTTKTVTDGVDVERKNFVQTGFITKFLDTLLTTDFAYDPGNTAYTGNLVLRRNFGDHQTGLVYGHASDGFSASSLADTPATDTAQAFLSGPVFERFMGITNARYGMNTSYTAIADGVTTFRSASSLSGRFGSLSLSNSLQYTVTETPLGEVTPFEDRVMGSLSAASSYAGGRWRISSSYDVQPYEILSFAGQYTYPFSNQLEGVAEIQHNIDSKLTQIDLSANWLADKFSLSPRISVDSENKFTFSTNLRFSLAPDPYSGQYQMFRKSLSGNGGVASRVFMDLNGDGLYNNGEELLEEAEIHSIQGNRHAYTDKKGIAFIPDLARARKTDVVLEPNSLPDVYYISLEDGYSLIPRPGVTSQIDFPVVVAGEMDGDAQYKAGEGSFRPARNLKISLIAPDGTIEKSTTSGQDGFYVISTIRPGFYYLTVETTGTMSPGYILPMPLTFVAEGSTYFGQNIALDPGYKIPYRFSSTNSPPGGRKTRVVRPIDIASQTAMVHVGEYRSNILLRLSWYKLQMKTKGLFKYFSLATPIADIQPDPITGLLSLPLKPHHQLSMTQATKVCEMLQGIDLPCAVEVITTYHETVPSAKNPEKTAPNSKAG